MEYRSRDVEYQVVTGPSELGTSFENRNDGISLGVIVTTSPDLNFNPYLWLIDMFMY